MTVLSFRDGRPVTDPWSLRCLIVELAVELEEARRSAAYREAFSQAIAGRGLPDDSRPRLYLVSAPDELEPEWDSEDSGAYQDRIEAGLEPEWPDD